MITVSVDVGYIDVVVEMSDFDSNDLISEIETRGFEVLEDNDPRLKAPEFEPEEMETLVRLIESQNPAIGSALYFVREKLIRT
jgi:hypothetical protein